MVRVTGGGRSFPVGLTFYRWSLESESLPDVGAVTLHLQAFPTSTGKPDDFDIDASASCHRNTTNIGGSVALRHGL